MVQEDLKNTGRWALVMMAGASLAACASLTTPEYAIHPGAAGSLAAPPANSTVSGARAPDSRGGGTNAPYQVGGIWYVPHEQPNYDQTGIASWYGDAFNMKATADGEIFDMNQFSAAHTTLPLPSMVEVTNLDNGRKLVVRVNDRGPFVGGRVIDLSRAAARELGYDQAGTAHVRVKYVGPAPLAGPGAGVRVASASSFAPRYPISRSQVASPAPATISPSAPNSPLADDEGLVLTSYKPPAPVSQTSLNALPDLRPAAVRAAPMAPAVHPSTATPSPAFRIQAGAFSDEERARRAATQLAGAGTASVEPFEKNGVTLYRVFVPGAADEVQAYAVRDKVAAAGFADARVVGPAVQ